MKQRLNNSKISEKKKSEHSKKHLFLNVWKTWCDVKEIDDGIEENDQLVSNEIKSWTTTKVSPREKKP